MIEIDKDMAISLLFACEEALYSLRSRKQDETAQEVMRAHSYIHEALYGRPSITRLSVVVSN